MRIENSQVTLASTHLAEVRQQTDFSMESNFRTVFGAQVAAQQEDQAAARERAASMLQSLVEAIIAAIQGKAGTEKLAAEDCLPQKTDGELANPGGPRYEWHCQLSTERHESEKTMVSGQGLVKTADGREIAFDFSLNLSREYTSTEVINEAGSIVLKDPLVINFSGKSAELSETGLNFDLNADGIAERIPALAGGSAYLVFDRNANGRADDGSELFGALSGNGFSDLGRLDEDGNGWIDEGDSAFSALGVWNGQTLTGLKESGVGALCTAAVDAPFALKTDDNRLLGQIRAAGLYLSEAGEVGHLQELDLAVSAPAVTQEEPEQRQRLAA